jgi:uncharacterized protein
MKQYSLLLLFITSFFVAPAQKKKAVFYKPVPAQFIPVNDFAGILTLAQVNLLSQKIQQYRDSSGHVLVIITHKNLTDAATGEEYSIEEAALHYFNKWKIGDKDRNDGVLLFVAVKERKLRIATGKGIDDILTDEICQSIIDNDIVPQFKQQRYYEGIAAAVNSIKETLSPAIVAKATLPQAEITQINNSDTTGNPDTTNYSGGLLIMVFTGIVLWAFSAIRRGRLKKGGAVYTHTDNTTFINNSNYSGRRWYWPFNSYYNAAGDNYYSNGGLSSNDSNNDTSIPDSGESSSYGGGSSNDGGASGSW